MQIFPTHRHSSWILTEWSQLHTLIKLSSDVLSADKASPTVAEMERDLRAGFPRQRSDTTCASKLKAMQKWQKSENMRLDRERWRLQNSGGGGGGWQSWCCCCCRLGDGDMWMGRRSSNKGLLYKEATLHGGGAVKCLGGQKEGMGGAWHQKGWGRPLVLMLQFYAPLLTAGGFYFPHRKLIHQPLLFFNFCGGRTHLKYS